MRQGIVIFSAAALLAGAAAAQDGEMSFFVTSEGPGNGADLGGLDGADAHCAQLAEAAGAGGGEWKAYLSSSAEDARDRIGSGPWVNANGETVAESVEELHAENNLNKLTAITENGEMVPGREDSPNQHDILTGSGLEGRLKGGACSDWTSSGEGSAWVGHHDRIGGGANPQSWVSAHESNGCGLEDLRSTGGEGYFYCFAAN